MTRALAIALLMVSVTVPGVTRPLAAQTRVPRPPIPQPLMAIARNDLSFGTVLAGIPSAVDVFDHRRAGLFQIEGPEDANVRVELVVPSALTSSGGEQLVLSFSARDAFADFSMGRPPRGSFFDPSTPLISSLGPNGRLYVRLGGTVLPRPAQGGGVYRATIYLTVYDLGS